MEQAQIMGLRHDRRKINVGRRLAIKRFKKQRQRNVLASPGSHRFIIVLDHLKPRYNIGKIFRSADAFGAHEVHLVGIDFFDPAPSMGSFKWVPAKFFDNIDSCFQQLLEREYHLYLLDPSTDSDLTQIVFPRRSAFIFGHEEYGFSFDPLAYAHLSKVSIPQYGKVQSLNVSVAASLTMYEYVRQHRQLHS
jgi:tRNA G18 (ribose-2'-O)-methylase SpoU